MSAFRALKKIFLAPESKSTVVKRHFLEVLPQKDHLEVSLEVYRGIFLFGFLGFFEFFGFFACATRPYRPCTQGGQLSREVSSSFQGIKRCYQIKDKSGNLVNHGKYYEWYNNDKIAVVGEYKEGKKMGRWIEYDESGRKLSDKYFDDGKEIPHP